MHGDVNNGLNGLNGFGRFVFNRLRLNMCCCVLRRQDTSATDGCSENPINQINPLWKNILLGCEGMNNGLNGFGRFVFYRLRLNMCCCVLRRQDTSATDGCSENPINQINPL